MILGEMFRMTQFGFAATFAPVSTRLKWLLAVTVAGASQGAQAQVAGGTTDVRPPTREQAEVPLGKAEAPKPQVNVDSRRAIDAGPCPLRDSTVRVDLQTVRYAAPANETVPPELLQLLAPIGPSVTGDQPIAAVCDIRDAANAALNRAGYVALVQIPPQEITGGELQLTVIAARITDIVVRGDADRYRNALRPRVEQLKALYPLNKRDAERILLLAGDIPGLNVQLVLRAAGTKPGEVIGDMVVDASSVQVIANVQNAGSHQLGRELGTVRADIFGLTGLSDRTFLAVSNSFQFKEQHVIQGGHEFGLGGSGFRLGLRNSYAISQPSIPNLALRSRTIIAGLDLSYPIIRQVSSGLAAFAGVEYLNQETRVRTGQQRVPFTRDRLTIAFARVEGYTGQLRADGTSSWSLVGNAELRQGVNLFNPTPRRQISGGFSPSRFDGNGRATVVRGTLDGSWSPVRGVWLNGSVFGQWSNSALLNLEEFSIGNLTYGRGFDPGANGADRALAYRIEPRVRITDFGSATSAKKIQLEASAFYDSVRIWNRDTGTIETRRTLDSVGGGLRAIVSGRVIFDLTYAKPLKRALSTDRAVPTDRLLFSITTKLLPWRSK
jgi:hemolysin activation/secretion protein